MGKHQGISHYGIHPDLLPRESIMFDTFHLKCSTTGRLMSTVRDFILNQSTDVIALFSQSALKKFWNDYHLYLYNVNNKSFSLMVGDELALFVASSEDIIQFFHDKFVQTNEVRCICTGFNTWVKLFKFLGVTYLGDNITVEQYKDELNVFKQNLKIFYDAGKTTYLSSALGEVGEGETFYMQILRYYIPKIVGNTFQLHNLDVGIFTTQGFERRNKESKQCLQRFSKYKGNVLVNSLRRVWVIFDSA